MNIKKVFVASAFAGMVFFVPWQGQNNFVRLIKAKEIQQPIENEDFEIKDGCLIKYRGSEKEITIPEGVKTIKSYAFTGQSFEVLNLPESLEKIESYAITECKPRSITFGGSLKQIDEKAIGYYTKYEFILSPTGPDNEVEYWWIADIRMYGPEDSIAKDYAKKIGFIYNDQVVSLLDQKELKTYHVAKNYLQLYWDTQYLIDGYYVYRSESKNDSYKLIGKVPQNDGPENFFPDKNCKPGKTYYYQVRTYREDKLNNKFITSDNYLQTSASARIGDIGVTADSSSSSSIKISWFSKYPYLSTGEKDIKGYYIWRAESKNGSYKKIADIKSKNGKIPLGKPLNYTDKNLKIGKTYYYKVNAYDVKNKTYDGALSNAVKAKPELKSVTNFFCKRKNATTINLNWKKNTDATGYIIYRKEEPNISKNIKIVTIKKASITNFTDKKIKKGSNYTYIIKAYKKVNKKNYYSPNNYTYIEATK